MFNKLFRLFRYSKPKIRPKTSLPQIIRKITGKNLPGPLLLGTPEGTVISITQGYYLHKLNNPNLSDEKIFEAMIKMRMYSNSVERQIKSDVKEAQNVNSDFPTLHKFVSAILKAENQTLPQDRIDELILKYKKEMALE